MRRKRNYKREHKPDFKHGSVAVGRFINYLMEAGEKFLAQKILFNSFYFI